METAYICIFKVISFTIKQFGKQETKKKQKENIVCNYHVWYYKSFRCILHAYWS